MSYLANWIAAGILLLAAPLAAAEWKPFISDSGQFKALFPVEPVASARKLPAGSGEIDYHSFVAVTAKGTVVYSISYSDYPSAIPAVDRQRFLAAARDATLKGLDGKLAADTEMQILGHSGREFTIVAESEKRPVLFHSRSFVAGKRMYQLQIVRMGNTPLDLADAIRFFAHLELQQSPHTKVTEEVTEEDLLRETRVPKSPK
jgi:hypothetical protein